MNHGKRYRLGPIQVTSWITDLSQMGRILVMEWVTDMSHMNHGRDNKCVLDR